MTFSLNERGRDQTKRKKTICLASRALEKKRKEALKKKMRMKMRRRRVRN